MLGFPEVEFGVTMTDGGILEGSSFASLLSEEEEDDLEDDAEGVPWPLDFEG
jgi:hypothetical protein